MFHSCAGVCKFGARPIYFEGIVSLAAVYWVCSELVLRVVFSALIVGIFAP